MSKPLSERLEAEANLRRCCGQVHIVKLLDDAAALARRVEGADRVKVIDTGGSLIATATPTVVRAKAGDTLLLVPVEGGA